MDVNNGENTSLGILSVYRGQFSKLRCFWVVDL